MQFLVATLQFEDLPMPLNGVGFFCQECPTPRPFTSAVVVEEEDSWTLG